MDINIHQAKKALLNEGMRYSMSRVERFIDNSPIESFWGKLKCEMYYFSTFETYQELELVKAMVSYIDYYNNERYQKRLNGLSQLEFRAQAT